MTNTPNRSARRPFFKRLVRLPSLSGQSRLTQGLVLTKLVLPLVALILLVVAVSTAFFAYRLGVERGLKLSMAIATDDKGNALTVQDIKAIHLENSVLKSEMETLIKERDISLNNLNLIKDELQSLRSGNSELEKLTQELSQTLEEQSSIKGKALDVVKMSLSENQGAYAFRFDVLVPSIHPKPVVPKLTLLNATSMVEVPLKPDSYDAKGLIVIQGRLVLPEGFSPTQLQLTLSSGSERIVKLYNWQMTQ